MTLLKQKGRNVSRNQDTLFRRMSKSDLSYLYHDMKGVLGEGKEGSRKEGVSLWVTEWEIQTDGMERIWVKCKSNPACLTALPVGWSELNTVSGKPWGYDRPQRRRSVRGHASFPQAFVVPDYDASFSWFRPGFIDHELLSFCMCVCVCFLICETTSWLHRRIRNGLNCDASFMVSYDTWLNITFGYWHLRWLEATWNKAFFSKNALASTRVWISERFSEQRCNRAELFIHSMSWLLKKTQQHV